jgi:glutamyl-tRNA reductase
VQQYVQANLQARQGEARQAKLLIEEEVVRFMSQLRTQSAAPTIRQLRAGAEHVREQTLEQARRMLAAGRSPEDTLAYLADTLTHRLIHQPTHRLRQAAESGDDELVDAARTLFHLDRPGE